MSTLTFAEIESKAIARERVRRALRHIEAAQYHLSDACQQLSPIDGLCPEWELVCKHYDKVKALWYKIDSRASSKKYDLDSSAKAKIDSYASELDKPNQCWMPA